MQSHDTAEVGILRLAPGLRSVSRDDGSAILLTRAGRYVRIGRATRHFLQSLSREQDGMAVFRVAKEFPQVDLNSLISCGIIDYLPPFSGAPDPLLAGQLWRRNLRWRLRLRLRGWAAFELLVAEGPDGAVDIPRCRPVALDQVEAAARLSLAMPGTSAQCTVVSAAIHDCLQGMGFPARVVLLGSADQFMFHARAYVGQHAVDPADALVDLEPFRPVSSGERSSIRKELP